jgi:hypothetical protein
MCITPLLTPLSKGFLAICSIVRAWLRSCHTTGDLQSGQ